MRKATKNGKERKTYMRKATKNGQREKNIHEKGNTKWSKGRKLQKILEIIYKVVQEVD